MSSKTRKRKIFMLVMAGLFVLKIITAWVSYFQSSYNFNNPLIPRAILYGIRDYTIFITGVYVIAIIIALLYILTKKFFWLIAVLLVTVFVFMALAGPQIQQYYIK